MLRLRLSHCAKTIEIDVRWQIFGYAFAFCISHFNIYACFVFGMNINKWHDACLYGSFLTIVDEFDDANATEDARARAPCDCCCCCCCCCHLSVSIILIIRDSWRNRCVVDNSFCEAYWNWHAETASVQSEFLYILYPSNILFVICHGLMWMANNFLTHVVIGPYIVGENYNMSQMGYRFLLNSV